jgi:mRNA interferase RelE/StbE
VASYDLLIKPSARRELEGIRDRSCREALVGAIAALATNPRPSGCQKISGADHLFRIRVGVFRVIYEVIDRRLTITVIRVGHRRDVYRG